MTVSVSGLVEGCRSYLLLLTAAGLSHCFACSAPVNQSAQLASLLPALHDIFRAVLAGMEVFSV